MAGHSKWKNIQHRKGRQDARRAKMFTKLSKEIYTAVRHGGADTETNLRLRLAISKAKEANMPNDNIERTIKKATGEVGGIQYDEITYEGYGPNGVAVMVDVLTDNRNRSAASVRHIFSRNGGNLGESGCVSYLFERKGVITISLSDVADEEAVMMMAVEAGAEDVQFDEDTVEIITEANDFEKVKQHIVHEKMPIQRSELTMLPTTMVEVDEEGTEAMIKLIEDLEDDDDVQQVYTNVDFNEQILAQL